MSTQTQGVRSSQPLRGYRRRKTGLDLNVPPAEARVEEGTSSSRTVPQQQTQSMPPHPPPPPATIDVDALDDDVIESSPRAFAQAKNNAQRTRGRSIVVDVDSGRTTGVTHNTYKRQRPSQTIINCDLFINLESSSSNSSTREKVQPAPPPPPPPPKEPTFTCPICLCPLEEEVSTKCGHIFCNQCIRDAIKAQAKCPSCRKRVTVKELIRVFLPATS